MKVNFIRKPTRIKELFPQDEFIIEKVVEIDEELFKEFLKNLLQDYDFIKKNIDLMYCDEDNVLHCIYVTTKESDFGILIEAENYSYAKYCAYLPKVFLTINNEQ